MALSQMSDDDWTREFVKYGLNGQQVGKLFRIRRENEARRELEQIPYTRRLEFIRWLVQTGRLTR